MVAIRNLAASIAIAGMAATLGACGQSAEAPEEADMAATADAEATAIEDQADELSRLAADALAEESGTPVAETPDESSAETGAQDPEAEPSA